MIEIIPKERYVNFRIGRRDLRRLIGLLPYVDLPRASHRMVHPYSQDEAPFKDQDLIDRLIKAYESIGASNGINDQDGGSDASQASVTPGLPRSRAGRKPRTSPHRPRAGG